LERGRGRIVDFVTGSREAARGKRLWDKIKDIECSLYYGTDNWPAYEQFIAKTKHKISKKETVHIESSNSNVRHYLARFRRKTKCYSKSEKLVELSLYLLIYKPLILSIF
jgi:insertion element IS1 protein InsB